jgi:hypothetical protein
MFERIAQVEPLDVRVPTFVEDGVGRFLGGDVRLHELDSHTVGGSVSSTDKQKFQAVSVAYEIVWKPGWKNTMRFGDGE